MAPLAAVGAGAARRRAAALPLLLLVAAAGLLETVAGAQDGLHQGGGGTVAYIRPSAGGDGQLRAALQDQNVGTVYFLGDYDVGDKQFADLSGPYKDGTAVLKIRRNLTLAGEPGRPPPLLDLRFTQSVAELVDACTLTLRDLAITNDRRGANAQLDFLLGEGGSVVRLTNVLRRRLSCVPIGPALALVGSTRRSPRFPGPGGSLARQLYRADDVSFRGRLYPKTLHLLNYSVEFPRHYTGGYAMVLSNVWRACDNFIDPSCLDTSDADVCVYEDMGRLLAQQQQQQQQQARLPPGAMAGVAIAAAVVAGALAAALWLLVDRRRAAARRVSSQSSGGACGDQGKGALVRPLDPELGGSSSPSSGAGGGSGTQSLLAAPPKSALSSSSAAVAVAAGSSGSTSSQPGGGEAGASSSGNLGREEVARACDIEFGQLLGSGSFGRVYKARWEGRDVAVKVIEVHDAAMEQCIAHEVQINMSCTHRNIVRAYHSITRIPPAAPSSGCTYRGSWLQPPDAAAAGGLQDAARAAAAAPDSTGGWPAAGRKALEQVQELLAPSGSAGGGAEQQQQQQSDAATPSAPHALNQQQQQPQAPASPRSVRTAQGSTLLLGSGGGSMDAVRSGLLGHTLPALLPAAEAEAAAPASPPGGSGADWGAALLDAGVDWGEPEAGAGGNATTFLVQEFCDGGTLARAAAAWWSRAAEGDAQMLARLLLVRDVARGLSYLHSHNVVHGDLNTRNVLISSDPSSPIGYTAKLADLGLARVIKQHATHHTTCTVGTMAAMPPELLRCGRISTALDIYSLGILMWELFTGQVAFRSLHYGQFFETVVLQDRRPSVPPAMPRDYRALLERCWATDPAERPAADAVLRRLDLLIDDRRRALGLGPGPEAAGGAEGAGAP